MLNIRFVLLSLLACGLAACSSASDLYEMIEYPDGWRELGLAESRFEGELLSYAVDTRRPQGDLAEDEWLAMVVGQVELPQPYASEDLEPLQVRTDVAEYVIALAPQEQTCSILFSPAVTHTTARRFVEGEIGPGWEDILQRTLVVAVGCD